MFILTLKYFSNLCHLLPFSIACLQKNRILNAESLNVFFLKWEESKNVCSHHFF